MVDQIFDDLEAEYCPPLDPALLSAILSDFDLGDAQSVRDARATLDPLKESALFEEQVGFDASGTGGGHDAVFEDGRVGESLPETSYASSSRETDMTTLSNGASPGYPETNLPVDKSDDGDDKLLGTESADYLESLDEDIKTELLSEIFGAHLNTFTIRYTLQKFDGKWNTAMESLLNQVYFHEAQTRDELEIPLKSIDAFAEELTARKARKGKRSKNRNSKELIDQRSIRLPVSSYKLPQRVEIDETTTKSKVAQPQSGGVTVKPARSSTFDANSFHFARDMAFAQAREAHRRAKSNHHMAGAAAYYSQVSRDLSALSLQSRAAEADELAETQSSASQIDLHGLDVANAVRISRDRVRAWWNGLGESRFSGRAGARESQSGYRIVVGVGRHSEGGTPKIGPAVRKMLREGGWKFEDSGGYLTVKGKVQR